MGFIGDGGWDFVNCVLWSLDCACGLIFEILNGSRDP